jgi:hypothetical protein
MRVQFVSTAMIFMAFPSCARPSCVDWSCDATRLQLSLRS